MEEKEVVPESLSSTNGARSEQVQKQTKGKGNNNGKQGSNQVPMKVAYFPKNNNFGDDLAQNNNGNQRGQQVRQDQPQQQVVYVRAQGAEEQAYSQSSQRKEAMIQKNPFLRQQQQMQQQSSNSYQTEKESQGYEIKHGKDGKRISVKQRYLEPWVGGGEGQESSERSNLRGNRQPPVVRDEVEQNDAANDTEIQQRSFDIEEFDVNEIERRQLEKLNDKNENSTAKEEEQMVQNQPGKEKKIFKKLMNYQFKEFVPDNYQEQNVQVSDSTSKEEPQDDANDLGEETTQPQQSKTQDDEALIDLSKENKSTLRETLIKGLTRKKIDCPICYEKIGLKGTIWSCQQCFHPFHLDCLKKWVVNSNPQQRRYEQFTWSCPNCQYLYTDFMPIYYCFCGKFKNPQFDQYITPHSCGESCGKLRGKNCLHSCDIPCHPGPCPPCTLKKAEPILCYCMRNKREVFCSDPMTAFECGQVCSKLLNCGIHECPKNCHPGDCKKCEIFVESKCFCEKETQSLPCGENHFSCEKICNKTLNCGNHKCQEICHPGPCAQCMLGPEEVDTCPCGNYSLLTLVGSNNRETCLDSIPVCGGVCKKKLSCGHSCKSNCHEGACPPCLEPTEEICRCKFTSRIVKCYELNQPGRQLFICDRICKKLKSCNFHPCNTFCCPARKGNDPDGVHLCLKVCDKPLSCGSHNCELFCHLGICTKCPIKVYDPISCVCGKTTLEPPQPCGTKSPECHYPCSRKKPCGHPCHLDCHQDACPPCEYKVDKTCYCGRQLIKDVSCSKEALCTIQCNKIMSCGHKCETVCHLGDCPKDNPLTGCGRKCGRNRKFCEHKCVAICHGTTECPNDPCKVEVSIRCRCGEREAFVECGSSDSALDRTLACNQLCKNISRFSRFHDKNKIYYPGTLIRFAKSNMLYLLKIEKKAETFIKSNERELTLPFQNDIPKKLSVQTLLCKHYHLTVQYYNHFSSPYFVIEKSPDVVIPKMLLSEYYKKVEKGDIKPQVLPFEVSLRFNISNRQDPNCEQLEILLRDFSKEYYVEREDRQLVVHFWEYQKAEMALKKLRKSDSIYNNFTIEENEKLAKEEENQQAAGQEVSRTKKRITPSVQIAQSSPRHSDEDEEQNNLDSKLTAGLQAQREHFADRANLLTMCSAAEKEERTSWMTIDIFEQDPRTAQMQGYSKWMVKSASKPKNKSQAQPSEIRPPDVLLATANYIATKILDANFYVNVPFKYPRDRQGKRRSHTFDDIYTFASDRFCAIREDIEALGEPTEETAHALEIMIRFYVLSFYEGQTIESGFDLRTLENDFAISMKILLGMYEKLQNQESKQEMLIYYLIFNSEDSDSTQGIISQIDRSSGNKRIEAIVRLVESVQKKEFRQFFQEFQNLGYLESCIAFKLFRRMREVAIQGFRDTKASLTIEELKEELFFESVDQALSYLKSVGFNVSKLVKSVQYETDSDEESSSEDDDEEEESEEEKEEVKEEKQQKHKIIYVEKSKIVEKKEEEDQKEKKLRVKRAEIDWRRIYEPNEQLFKESNSKISDKKMAINFPGYGNEKPTNNENIVTRGYLVLHHHSFAADLIPETLPQEHQEMLPPLESEQKQTQECQIGQDNQVKQLEGNSQEQC